MEGRTSPWEAEESRELRRSADPRHCLQEHNWTVPVARLISPGRRVADPPPTMATADAPWWGAR